MGKNTKRGVPHKTALEVQSRDGYCILCGRTGEAIHHVKYGLESNYSDTRNDKEELVLLCNACHHALHFTGGNNFREQCKEYLKNLYS